MSFHFPERFVSALTRDTLALVLAGGRGSRLGGLTTERAKPAVPFGGNMRIIDFALSNCVNSGVRRIGVLTQYKAHSLIRHLSLGWGFMRGELGEFVELLPAQQRTDGGWYIGTANAVYQNIDIIRAHDPRFVLILGGDHIYKMDYGGLLATHVEQQADVTVACMEVPLADACAFGIMEIEPDGRVCGFEEKPAAPSGMPEQPDFALASMGIYVFTADYLLDRLRQDSLNPASEHDFGKDILPLAVQQDRVFAAPFRDPKTGARAYWRDVGTLDSYWAANMELIGVVPELDLFDTQWPIRTHQVQAPPAKFVFDDEGRRGMAVDSMVCNGCIVSGALVRHSVLFSRVRVEESSRVTDSVLLPEVVVGPDCHIHKAVIETGCRLAAGTVIGVDPEQDRQRFEVSPAGVTLVTPEMLQQNLDYIR
ncbi:glucose-1-phosphate adenylyltransferase [Haliea sp. E1-2-M8]|uniref:glucose-1-phosphate adenylyltransferase n=1 Tax=Haliea sp. E1-2-M8 TaxID=3064706 RepID=UPI00271E0438|nr:glucose-1-phosphate adenylyltransferase [Haliea sp. E1-2-M8]MDO8862363.1 glucose-1-phosphate adenylyltransferase [Haliea sp. E1-2-M8]